MGTAIFDLVKGRGVEIKELKGKTLAFDSYNMLYQFLSSIRQRDGTLLMDSSGKITSHLIGLFNRIGHFLQNGIKPIFVFDGEAPELKGKESEKRNRVKRVAAEKLKKAKTDEERLKYASMTSKLTKEMVDESKKLIKAFGLPIVQAPCEGEAQCAHIVKKGEAYATVSQDADSLLFGTNVLIRNFSVSGKRKMPGRQFYATVKPELIELKDVLNNNGIDQNQLIALAMLVGTDYNPGGIKNIGPKKALNLVKQYKTDLDNLFEDVKWDEYVDVSWQEVYYLIKKMKVSNDYELKWEGPNAEEIKKILISEHDFSEERVKSMLSKLSKAAGKTEQRGLQGWV